MIQQRLSEASGVEISNQTLEKFDTYRTLVEKWNPRINLVSRATLAEIGLRHFVDSAQLYRYCPAQASLCADLGSGGGFPGLVLAIIFSQVSPDTQHVLVESDQRKAVFLQEVIRATGCHAEVRNERIEVLATIGAQVVTARALAPLPVLFGLISRHLSPGGRAILPKGAGYKDELAAARALWDFDVAIYPSTTNPEGHVLEIEGLSEKAGNRVRP